MIKERSSREKKKEKKRRRKINYSYLHPRRPQTKLSVCSHEFLLQYKKIMRGGERQGIICAWRPDHEKKKNKSRQEKKGENNHRSAPPLLAKGGWEGATGATWPGSQEVKESKWACALIRGAHCN